MALRRQLLCFAFALVLVCIAAENTDEKTTEAVVKAVVQAESQPKATPKNAHEEKEAKHEEEANAVAKATTGVLKSEAQTDIMVDESVVQAAKDNAKKTFEELADGGVAPKAAADAAAKVAVETVDGAVDLALPDAAKVNAEKAAIAAGKAVADHPDDQAKALTEAISTVKKEEKTRGQALQKDKSKGLVASAMDAASDLPKLAEDGTKDAVTTMESYSKFHLFLFVVVILGLGFSVKNWEMIGDKVGLNTPYSQRLRAIREEFASGASSAEYRETDIETQYSGFTEMR